MGYHVRVHSLAQSLLTQIRREELLSPGDRLGVAVSGGIDSVALLRLLLELRAELGIGVSVVHFGHKLRGAESEADQEFVAGLALEFGLEFFAESGNVARHAAEEHCGVEAAARELRYGFFQRLLGAGRDLEGTNPSRAEARHSVQADQSAAPSKGLPPRLKPASFLYGSDAGAEAAPFQIEEKSQSQPFPSETKSQPQQSPRLTKIATGHTLDDQAETVVMRIIRGTGMRGLGGIYPRVLVQDDDQDDAEVHGEIIRPLLGVRRRELENYLLELEQPWREDSSNADSRFTRNRMRKLVLPVLEREFNPAVVERLAELAGIARDEEDYWENEVSGWLGTVVQWSEPEWMRGPEFGGPQGLVQIGAPQSVDEGSPDQLEESGYAVMNPSISRPWLLTEPKAVQRRVLKAIGEQTGIPFEFKHIEEVLRFAAEDGPQGKGIALPLGWRVVREPAAIVFISPDPPGHVGATDYEYPLPVPGSVFLPELGGRVEALLLPPEATMAGYNPQQLVHAALLTRPLLVRNWRAGDRYWPAHTKAPKKVKELLQELHLSHTKRKAWPVVLSGPELVWMRDFPVPLKYRASPGEQAVLIREVFAEAEFEGEGD